MRRQTQSCNDTGHNIRHVHTRLLLLLQGSQLLLLLLLKGNQGLLLMLVLLLLPGRVIAHCSCCCWLPISPGLHLLLCRHPGRAAAVTWRGIAWPWQQHLWLRRQLLLLEATRGIVLLLLVLQDGVMKDTPCSSELRLAAANPYHACSAVCHTMQRLSTVVWAAAVGAAAAAGCSRGVTRQVCWHGLLLGLPDGCWHILGVCQNVLQAEV